LTGDIQSENIERAGEGAGAGSGGAETTGPGPVLLPISGLANAIGKCSSPIISDETRRYIPFNFFFIVTSSWDLEIKALTNLLSKYFARLSFDEPFLPYNNMSPIDKSKKAW